MTSSTIIDKIPGEEKMSDVTPKLAIFAAEIIGTAILVFIGCMGTCVPDVIDVPVVPHFGAFGFGFAVLMAIQVVGHISSAHLNPQVTLAAFILGKISAVLIPIYFGAEFIGALLGFGLLQLVIPSNHTTESCLTLPQDDVTVAKTIGIEIIITCILVLACGGVWDIRNARNTDSSPVRFAFVVVGISMVAGPYTGASMNSARSFAPALFNNDWSYQWIYWVGPTIGALIGALLYRYVLSSRLK